MAESLLNLGGAIQNMIGLAQLGQMRERTAMIQQDREIDERRAKEREKVNRIHANLEIAKHPALEGTNAAVEALVNVGREIDFDLPKDEVYAGRKAIQNFYTEMANPEGTAATRKAAFFEVQKYSPTATGKALDNWDKFSGADDRDRLKMLAMQKVDLQIRALNSKQASVELRDDIYTKIDGMMDQMVKATQIKDAEGKRGLGEVFRKIHSSDESSEAARDNILMRQSVVDLDKQMRTKVTDVSAKFAKFYNEQNRELLPFAQAIEQAQAQGREVEDADLQKVKAFELLGTAQQAVQEWAAQPYNKKAWARFQNVMRQVKVEAVVSKKDLSGIEAHRESVIDIAQQKMNLAVNKDERLALNESAQKYGQQQFLELVAGGMAADKAGVEAGKRTEEMFKVLPDSSKFKDPKLSNTLGIREMTPAVETDIQRGLLATESALNMIGNIESVLATSNIGLNAMIKSNVYGFSQQISTLAQSALSDAQAMKAADPKGLKDFTPSKWFDPNIPKVDLLAHSLAMALIKSEQGSRPSDKDFANKVKSLGLQSAMANAPDARVRLKTLREQMEYQRTVYSRLAGKFAERVQGSTGADNSPATAAEYFKRKGIPLPTEEETP